MPKSNGHEPTQETPQGAEIPIPTKEQVFRDLGKVAKSRLTPADDEAVSDIDTGSTPTG
jgi:hypothetical protein